MYNSVNLVLMNDAIESTDIVFVSHSIKTHLSSYYLYYNIYVHMAKVYHFAF